MSEGLWSVLIGALIALAGVLLTNVVAMKRESRQREWQSADRQGDRRAAVLDRMCDNAESYIQAIVKDCRLMMNDAEFYLTTDDYAAAQARMDARRRWKDELDTSVFAHGPFIISIRDQQLE